MAEFMLGLERAGDVCARSAGFGRRTGDKGRLDGMDVLKPDGVGEAAKLLANTVVGEEAILAGGRSATADLAVVECLSGSARE